VVFGERADLVAEAHARIQAHPGRYIDHVYGEFRGRRATSYLNPVAIVPFAELGRLRLPSARSRKSGRTGEWFTIPFAVTWGPY